MCDHPAPIDLALMLTADYAVVRTAAMIQRTRWDIAMTQAQIEQGRQSIARSRELLKHLSSKGL